MQEDEIAGNELLHADLALEPGPNDGRAPLKDFAEREHRTLGLASWTKPRSAFSNTIAAIAAASIRSPISAETRAAAISAPREGR